MKLYSDDKNYKLYHGSMLDMAEVIEPESIDAIITDPPYELNFMNKGWDNSGIAFQKDTWKKCYDALKPGGHLLAFGGSRTFHRIACAIEDAGFEIRDTIMWIYGSGFPKSMNIGLAIDKRNGRNVNQEFIDFIINHRKLKNLSAKDVAELGGWYGNVNHGGTVRNWENGSNIPTKEQYAKLKEILDLDDSFDEYINIEPAEREIIGKMQNPASSIYTMGEIKKNRDVNITAPSTDLAKQWNGWGTQLKPSYEPIIIARKPCERSIVDNVMKYGVGGINIDECRVPISKNDINMINAKSSKNPTDNYNRNESKKYGDYALNIAVTANEQSRFPANTILTYDDSDYDEVCGGLSDEGSASRYFYCAKASKRDRNEGLKEFEDYVLPKNGSGKRFTVGGSKEVSLPRKNIHPTVKPTSLMQYLVRLVTPKGGTVLDPFNGSGSTGKACMYENADRKVDYKYIGIELTEEYLPIAKARIEFAEKTPIMDYIEPVKTEELQSKNMLF